ncbi:MAG: ABC transporter permease, partial [Thermanaerothrix sp.]|nr:ABC transporter permease [Thermanaerothrix sp.]
TMSISRGMIFGWTQGWPVRDLPDSFRALGFDFAVGDFLIPVSLVITLILASLVAFVMNNTVLGTYIFALGNSERAVVVAGVNHVRVKTLVYVMSGVLAAVSGLLLTARLGVAAPTAAEGYELSIIAAAVIGGASLFGGEGGVVGVLLGAAFIQVLNNALVLLGVAAHWQTAALGIAALIALLADYLRRRKILQED